MSLLKNKIAVITGGSSGIGFATAKRFVEEGAYVFIACRRQAELDKAVAEIGQNITSVKTDISKLDDLDRLYEIVAKKGKIDVIFASAAFVEKTMTASATPEHFDKTFNINACGPISPFKGLYLILIMEPPSSSWPPQGRTKAFPDAAPTAPPRQRSAHLPGRGPTNSRIEKSGPTC